MSGNKQDAPRGRGASFSGDHVLKLIADLAEAHREIGMMEAEKTQKDDEIARLSEENNKQSQEISDLKKQLIARHEPALQ